MTASDYRAATGADLGLAADEAALCVIGMSVGEEYGGGTLSAAGRDYRIAADCASFPPTYGHYGVVLPDEEALNAVYRWQKETLGAEAAEITERIGVSFGDRDAMRTLGFDVEREITQLGFEWVSARESHSEDVSFGTYSESLWEAAAEIYGVYGSFLFLGILLGLVFLFGTALIIYYKQISEGYEDRGRYQIMEKIGMSQKEVKASVGQQVLLVFFLPLVTAGVHICFAFPILEKLLHVLLLSETKLFVVCTLITFVLFALVYAAIYSVTSRTYYKIVH
jgi:putative ABC transport system permease protein